MEKKCIKCGEIMESEEGVYTCARCLEQIVKIKREQWESGSKIIEVTDGSSESVENYRGQITGIEDNESCNT